MPLAAGTRIGPYEIQSLLGTGGMGEVYRAREAKLNRDVALKILPGGVAVDHDRLARFRREAQLLAALSHPNIGQIYGFEDDGAVPALVLELVEGPTLADRIVEGPLEIVEALRIAVPIALALESAHHQSIIHRDLKPANVKVREDGTVKVLDFGLAKALDPASASTVEAANSPTLTNRATALGVILGTAAYMSPEQAKGKPVDSRADVWAFGVVLYEMLTGRRPFVGEGVSDTLAEVLKSDPDWHALPAATPPPIRRLLRRCLERDPKRRLQDIADARLEIEDVLASPAEAATGAPPDRRRRERAWWLTAIGATAAASAALAILLRPHTVPDVFESRLHIVAPGVSLVFAIAPDDQSVAYWATVGGKTQLWLRPLASEVAQPLPGTDGGGGPIAWAADGRSLLYAAGTTLKEVSIDGGAAHVLPVQVGGFGLTRNADGVLLFAPANAAPIARVSVRGGAAVPATRLDSPQVGHRWPHFLPDGRHFLFLASGPRGVQGIYLGTLDTLDSHRLVDADTAAVFAPPNFVVFGRQDTLYAQRLNLRTFAMEGEPERLADGLMQNRTVFGSASLAASLTGTVAYRQLVVPTHQLVWFDRTGEVVSQVGGVDASETDPSLRLSPDERTIILGRRQNGNMDLWTIANAPHGALQRFTSDPTVELGPVWSPDGTQIAFQASRKGGGFYDLYRRPVGGGAESILLESDDNKTMGDWSADNRYWLFVRQGREQTPRDIWAMPVTGDGKPFAVTSSPYDEFSPRFSPDSRWIVYQSNAAGTADIYVRRFPGPGREWRISSGGGTAPKWRGDGGEIFYAGRNNKLMAVTIRLPAAGDALEHDTPVPLFDLPRPGIFVPSRDGKKFLVRQFVEDVPVTPITLIQNWQKR
jgi:Tol biopolymer transport system component